MSLPLAQRVDILFRALHSPDEGEPTPELIAAALRDRGVETTAADLSALRRGAVDAASERLLTALAEHFNQAPWFLTDSGRAQRVIDTYVQLDLLRALREAGVRRVRLRGRPATSDRQALTEALRARRQPPTRGESLSAATDPASE
ncbi:hypothetical protein OHB26_21625 [Nocardia sp. NBC_01503]|uniref:hypothetical protein n=1 Tax=Nocardia sp. NBC_01503 TaxID=2975997 RepID=UPI002E7BCBC7|nr:hypothetical protein [Nocardia sp. NBC_01503]WTL29587.1 hypothetical protein OHB26_21625 [Nocardia sp. NBC_01503]